MNLSEKQSEIRKRTSSIPWERSLPRAPSPSEEAKSDRPIQETLHRSPHRSLHRRRSPRLAATRTRHRRRRKRCRCCCDCCCGRSVNRWPSPWVSQSRRNELRRTIRTAGRGDEGRNLGNHRRRTDESTRLRGPSRRRVELTSRETMTWLAGWLVVYGHVNCEKCSKERERRIVCFCVLVGLNTRTI